MGNNFLGQGPQTLYHIRYYFQMLSVKAVFHILLTIKQIISLQGRMRLATHRAAMWKRPLEFQSSNRDPVQHGEPPEGLLYPNRIPLLESLQTKMSFVCKDSRSHVEFISLFSPGNVMFLKRFYFEIFQTYKEVAIIVQRILCILHSDSSNVNRLALLLSHSVSLIIYNCHHYYCLT